MDSDCLICMGSHHSSDCNERKLQHCMDCHIFIRHCSDHNKRWVYDIYDQLYVSMPPERCNIGLNCDFRFYHNDTWRKPNEGIDAYSTGNGIYFNFKTDKDIALLSNGFVHARILIVVKGANGEFHEKLVLMTSKMKMLLAASINKPFNRASALQTQTDTSMILAVSGDSSPNLSISVFPKNGSARHLDIRFDSATQSFQIPDELKVETAMSAVATTQQCTTVAVYQNFTRSFEMAVGQQQENNRCFECHIPVKRIEDHAEKCGTKWFISQRQNVYVAIPAVRFVLRFDQPLRILMNGEFINIERDGNYFSSMADTLFKIAVTGTIELLTTGFTRVRVPIVVEEVAGRTKTYKEKLVLVTSYDRTIVCAKGSRCVDAKNALDGFKHNTPLMLCVVGYAGATIKVDVHSSGANVHCYEIPLVKDRNGEIRFEVPAELDIASKGFTSNTFDAVLPYKKPKRNA